MAEELNIVYREGNFCVRKLYRLACRPCVKAWGNGTLTRPADGGKVCLHGDGRWSVGIPGPHGGWQSIMEYNNERAARHVARALAEAAEW